MLSEILIAAVLIGMFKHSLVHNKKAFGICVILVVAEFVVAAIGMGNIQVMTRTMITSYQMGMESGEIMQSFFFITLVLLILLKIATIILLFVAYWPGGRLFKIGEVDEEQISEQHV